MNEIWKPVLDYEGLYEVSSLGRVRSLDRMVIRSNGWKHTVVGKILSDRVSTTGYFIASLRDLNKQPKNFNVHRLVMEAFVSRRPNEMEVNHIDGNIKNNRLENLEYVTHQQNIDHAYANGLMNNKARSKRVIALNNENEIIGDFYSAREAGRVLKMDGSVISKCCRGEVEKYKGLRFKYIS